MGLLDGLSSLAGGDNAAGMGGVLEHLAANGLADHVASWTGDGQNLPVSGDQLRDALGSDKVQQMASAAGQPAEDFLQQLSDHLSNNGAAAPSADS
jgi:uncharacterized protein YidB (DUF937 family)